MFRSSGGASFLLVVGTIFWGMTFVLIKDSIQHIHVFTFIFWRFTLAFLALCAIFFFKWKNINKEVWILGLILAFFMGVSIFTQTIGLQYTTASKSAFITGLAVVLVPLMNGLLYTKKFPRILEIIAVLLAITGIGMLTLTEGFAGLNQGDFLTLFCAVSFAFYIIKVDHFSKRVDPILLTMVQILFIACGSLGLSLCVNGSVEIPSHTNTWIGIVFCAIPATAVMFTIQNYYQRYVSPPLRVAIIFSLEPVFASITDYFYSGQTMTIVGIFGAILICVSMVLPEMKKGKTD